MVSVLIIPILLGCFVTLFSLPFWIRKAKEIGLSGKNMHKKSKEEIAEAGGVVVLLGFLLGTLTYIAIKTFYFKSTENLIEILALMGSVLIICLIGLLDDLLGWKKGLSERTRIFLLIFASIPLVVINAGESSMMGIELGLLYPLLLIPLGIVGASATFNFLAGYNGLESSQGIIILTALSIVTFISGDKWLSVIGLCMVAALFSFYLFNKYPAKVLPGDVLTYSVGALIAVLAILGNIEKIAIFFFIPYIIEVVLKVRGKFSKDFISKNKWPPQTFGIPNEDGSLELPYKKIYSLTHLSLLVLKKFKKKVYEKDVVLLINAFQIVIIALGMILFL